MQINLWGGSLGEPFQSVVHLGGDTMPGQGLLQVPLCRRIPSRSFFACKGIPSGICPDVQSPADWVDSLGDLSQ